MISNQLLAYLELLDARASKGPWVVEPRDIKYYQTVDGSLDLSSTNVLARADQDDFLGVHLHGPMEPGRGNFTVLDGVLMAELRNNLRAILDELKAARGL